MNIISYLSYTKIKELYESIDNKKKLIIITISVVTILILWYFLLILPLQEKSRNINTKARRKINSQLKTTQTTIIKLIQATQSPSNDSDESYAVFYKKIKNLYANNKIDTNIDMTINHLLNNLYGLKINGFKNNKIHIPKNIKKSSALFQPYEIKLAFTGSFMQMTSYLKQFDKPSFLIYLKNLDFGVTQYPKGHINLDLITVVADKKKTDKPSKETD